MHTSWRARTTCGAKVRVDIVLDCQHGTNKDKKKTKRQGRHHPEGGWESDMAEAGMVSTTTKEE